MQFLGSTDRGTPGTWEVLGNLELPDADGRAQFEECSVSKDPSDGNNDVNFVKVKLLKGWDDFAAIFQIIIQGE